jgi:archaemetzincin
MKKMPFQPSKIPPATTGCPSDNSYIGISPIGDISCEMCELIEEKVQAFFGYKTKTMTLLNDIDFAYDTNRKQYHSTSVLEKLAYIAPQGCIKILAITRVDLFIPILTHVFGEAQLDGKACIISTYRLNDGLESGDFHKINERIVKEAIHELGHTFNLRHCDSHECTMHYCRSLRDVDLKSIQCCKYCRILLSDEIKSLSAT